MKKNLITKVAVGVITGVLAITAIYYIATNNLSRKVYSYDLKSKNEVVNIEAGKIYRDIKDYEIGIDKVTLKEDLNGVKEYSSKIYIETKDKKTGKTHKEYIYGSSSGIPEGADGINIKAGEELYFNTSGGDGTKMEKKILDKLSGDVKMELVVNFVDGNKKEFIVPLELKENQGRNL